MPVYFPKMDRWCILAIAIGAGWLAFSACAQVSIQPRVQSIPKAPLIPHANLRVTTDLVLVPVTVEGELHTPITGLEKENFRIYEDKVEQPITAFYVEDAPIALGFVFDTSGSMRSSLPQGRVAAAQFLGFANPEDEFFLVEFNSAPNLLIPLTSDTGDIRAEILLSKSGGSTALVDALYMAMNEIKKSSKSKKALVVVSDGGENNSRYTSREMKTLVRESDVLVYSVLMPGTHLMGSELYGRELVKEIAEMTGGHTYDGNAFTVADIAGKIGAELRNQYVIGYTPRGQNRDGRSHSIAVKIVPPRGLSKLQAHWRRAYFAPAD